MGARWPDINRLHMLVEFDRLGSLAAVSESLSYSSSAVSQQMSTLQREVGVGLVRKRGKALELTEAGHLMVSVAKRVLLELEEAETRVAELGAAVGGRLKVACLQTVAQGLLPAAIELLAERHSQLTIDLVQDETLESLESLIGGAVHVAIAERYETMADRVHDDVTQLDLFTEPMFLATTVGHEKQDGGAALLAQAHWVLEPRSSPCGRWAVDWCRRQGFEPHIRYESSDLLTHVRFIERDLAVGFLPKLLAPHVPPSVQLLPLAAPQTRTVFLSTRTATRRHPAVKALHEALVEVHQRA